MKKISSPSNLKIKNVIKLKKSRERKKQGLIIVEGRHEIHLAEKANVKIEELYYCPELSSDKNFFVKLDKAIEVEESVFKKMSFREHPDGYLALVKPKTQELEKLKLRNNPLIIIMESLEKPGNIGAVLRTAEAVRADAIVICGSKTDIYNPNTIRASLGAIFALNLFESSSENTIKWLKTNKIKYYALSPNADDLYSEVDFKNSVAIVVGAEHEGLSDKWLKSKQNCIKIPMLGKIDSLNVSVSTSIVVFEVMRQRKFDFS